MFRWKHNTEKVVIKQSIKIGFVTAYEIVICFEKINFACAYALFHPMPTRKFTWLYHGNGMRFWRELTDERLQNYLKFHGVPTCQVQFKVSTFRMKLKSVHLQILQARIWNFDALQWQSVTLVYSCLQLVSIFGWQCHMPQLMMWTILFHFPNQSCLQRQKH